MSQLLAIYDLVPSYIWVAVIGALVSLFSELNKRLFGIESTRVIHIFVVSTAFAVATIQPLILNQAIPLSVLGEHAATFYLYANLFFVFVTKALQPFLVKVQAYELRHKEDKAAAKVTPVETGSGTTFEG